MRIMRTEILKNRGKHHMDLMNTLDNWDVMEPDFTGCLMHQHGQCEICFRFDLD